MFAIINIAKIPWVVKWKKQKKPGFLREMLTISRR